MNIKLFSFLFLLLISTIHFASGQVTSNGDAKYKEYMGDRLSPIRDKIKLYDEGSWTSIDKRKLFYEKKEGGIEYYERHGEVLKVKSWQWNNSKDSSVVTTIYLENKKPFFAFEISFDSTAYKEDVKWYEPYEDSIFFQDGMVIRIKASGDCGAPFAGEYLKEVEKEIYSLLDYSMKRYNYEIE